MSDRIIVTQENHERLARLAEQYSGGRTAELVEELENELARAEIVPSHAVPRDVVTVGSRVQFEDAETGASRTVELCWPQDVKGDPGKVSVLAPVGVALLGLRVGEDIDFPMPGGRTRTLKVTQVLYQPEAAHNSGDGPPPPQAA